MDQAAPAHQGVLRHNRERSEGANLDRRVRLRPRRHRQETPELNCSASLYEMLQILSLTMFERMPINQLLSRQPQASDERVSLNQLNLFE